jgi:hypothetical protein
MYAEAKTCDADVTTRGKDDCRSDDHTKLIDDHTNDNQQSAVCVHECI